MLEKRVARSVDADARYSAEAVALRSYGRLVALLTAERETLPARGWLSSTPSQRRSSLAASGLARKPEAWVLAVSRRQMHRRSPAATQR